MNEPVPPKRQPHYVWNEDQDWPLSDCASALIDTLCGFISPARDFKGDASGHIWVAYKTKTEARIAFTSENRGGHIQLSIDPSNWVRAEVFVSGKLKFRAWLEDPYEEKEFWPDGADGIVAPNDDPPGRISKRGRWLQFKRAAWPGVAAETSESNWWSVEDTFD